MVSLLKINSDIHFAIIIKEIHVMGILRNKSHVYSGANVLKYIQIISLGKLNKGDKATINTATNDYISGLNLTL